MKHLGPVLIAGVIFFAGCNKKEVDIETQSAVDNALAEQSFASILPTVNAILSAEPAVYRMDSSGATCAFYTVDTTGFPAQPAVMTIDYGTGCTDSDGRYKQGKMIVSLYNRWLSDTVHYEVTFDKFKMDQVTYLGTLEVDHYRSAAAMDYQVIEGEAVDPSWTISYECEKRIEQTAGSTTLVQDDDVFSLTGTSSGINRRERKFTTQINSPLIKAHTCKWFQSGVTTITPEGFVSRTLSFGDGECDNKATITINDNTYDFELR